CIFVADRSRGHIIFTYACGSTALLCPLIFGFPTEMWLAHALFWPALAIGQYARHNLVGTALVYIAMLGLVLTHEGALVLAAAIVLTLALRGLHDPYFRRASGALIAALTVWLAVKIMLPPDEYFAAALVRAALHFFDLSVFQVGVVLVLLATILGYFLVYIGFAQVVPHKAHLWAGAIVFFALAVYWLCCDQSVHASNRYYLRTTLVLLTPLIGAFAGLSAMRADGLALRTRRLNRLLATQKSGRLVQALIGAFVLVTLVHVVETKKFVVAWQSYKSAVAALATGSASDPALGDPRFVSSKRINPDLNQLSWNSTTPYLSVLVANLVPNRLVVDPTTIYFCLSCETATANYETLLSVPSPNHHLFPLYPSLHHY